MPYHIDWMYDQRVIHLRFWGDISPSETRTAYAALLINYEQGSTPLYLMVDHTNVTRYPIGLNNYDFVIEGSPADKFKQVLIVGPNRQVRFMVRLFARVRQVNTSVFEYEQEALAALPQRNAVLPDANVP